MNYQILYDFDSSTSGVPNKILATLHLDKPLFACTKLKLNSEFCWVDFKYVQVTIVVE